MYMRVYSKSIKWKRRQYINFNILRYSLNFCRDTERGSSATGTVIAIQYEDNLTITFGSILEMNIRKVKKDPEDVTLNNRWGL